jgi:hypothetical protein
MSGLYPVAASGSTPPRRSRGATLIAKPAVMWEPLRVAYLRDPENLIEPQEWLVSR